MTFLDLIIPDSESTIRSRIIGFAYGAGLKITSWIAGDVGEQIFEMSVATAYAYTQNVAAITRGYASLDTATDPGDPDPYDSGNEDLEPAPGFLSSQGENVHGTVRRAATFATGTVLFVNAGTEVRTFAPEGLTFTWTENSPPSPPPTYHNSADDSIYVNSDGTVTVDAGSSLEIPVTCDVIGAAGTCPSSSLSLTTTLLGCTATNTDAVIGTDRETAVEYRTNCRTASARISLGGPAAAYQYLATKNLDGTPLMNSATPPAPVGITRVHVSQDSATGEVEAYYASASGAAIAEDVTSANTNIEEQCFAVPDAISFTGSAATELSIHVTGVARIKATPGLTEETVQNAIVAALLAAWPLIPIGGYDQDSGETGVLYTSDISGWARNGYPGLYATDAYVPDGAVTAIPKGNVTTLECAPEDWTVVIVS